MHRFHLPPERARGPLLTLEGEEAHHALHVLRVAPGERAVLLDGAGGEFLCEIKSCDKHTVTLLVRQHTPIPPLPFRLTLVQAVPKRKTMETIVQKATELGAHRIVPVLSDRAVPQIEEDRSTNKVEKWRRVAIESIKQCGSAWLPTIDPPRPLIEWLARREPFDLLLVASLQPNARHPREYLPAPSTHLNPAHHNIAIFIGPEGDFTPAEMQSILSSGALPISLGPLVLRSDTAAIYSLSILSYELHWLTSHHA